MKYFVENIPPARPVVVLLDSHASHLSMEVMKFRAENGLIFITFPAHTTHLLQPLDVSVFGPMKTAWRKKVTSFMSEKGRKPTRNDFYDLFVPAYEEGATMKNIKSGFKNTGIYPFDNNALPDDTYRVGILHDVENNGSVQDNVLPKPQPFQNARVRQSAAQKSRVFDSLLPSSSSAAASSSSSAVAASSSSSSAAAPSSPPPPPEEVEEDEEGKNNDEQREGNEDPRPSVHATVTQPRTRRHLRFSSQNKESEETEEEDPDTETCRTCGGLFAEDKSGECWIQCMSCRYWFHELCQGVKRYRRNFKCSDCKTVQ